MDGGLTEMPLWMNGCELDRFMPMHLLLSAEGRIEAHGPTVARLRPDGGLIGLNFADLFEVRAPGGAVTMADILARAALRFRVVLRGGPRIGLRGVAMALPDGRVLANLSFGIDIVEAVRRFGLTDADFSTTDLAVELLYLREANIAVAGELKALNLRLDGARMVAEDAAMTDKLTGLRNRRAGDLVLSRLCEAGTPFGLMHMDLDYFKAVNDTLGHAAGDAVLVRVAEVLRAELRGSDCAARVGGDEFLVIFPETVSVRRLQAIAARIITALTVPIPFEGKECRIGASIGIARSLDYQKPDPVVLMNDVDTALYAAKHAGRGRAVLAGTIPKAEQAL